MLSFSNIEPVRESPDLRRIVNLPRRVWAPGLAEQLAEQWTPMLLNERGRAEWSRLSTDPIVRERQLAEISVNVCPLRLNTMQTMGLWEAYHNWPHKRGVYVNAAVGQGKTLFSRMLAVVTQAERPFLTVKASLLNKTHKDFAQLDTYWLAPNPPIQVQSYSILSTAKNAKLLCNCSKCTREPEPQYLDGYRPNLWVADESSIFRNPKNVVRKRAARYFKSHPDSVFCPMSATNLRKSIKNFEFLMRLALKDQTPLPFDWKQLNDWAQALDFSIRDGRRHWGALKVFMPETVKPTLDNAREGVQKRIAETFGVVLCDEQSCDKPIYIRPIKAPDDPILDKAFLQFRKTKATLDGWDLDGDPLTQLRYGTELGCGFYSRWDPRPPQEWLDARRDWMTTCREIIEKSGRYNRRPCDSAKQVAETYPDLPELIHWKEIEPTFKPNTVSVPVSMSILTFAKQWLDMNHGALVWVQHTWVGNTLASLTGLPYFRGKGLDSQGRYIDDWPVEKSAIVSTHANRFGRNLQKRNTSLVIGPEHSAEFWEQMLGREHRQGQLRPVYFDVIISCAENLKALEAACLESEFVLSMGKQKQKLMLAQFDWNFIKVEETTELPLNHPSKARWT